MNKFLKIDSEGYIDLDGIRSTDEDFGQTVLKSLRLGETGEWLATVGGETAIAEVNDAPLVAQMIEWKDNKELRARFAYNYWQSVNLDRLTLDDWDRVHGYTERQIPFVMNRAAQMELFNSAIEFDDDSLTFPAGKIVLPSWLSSTGDEVSESFWAQKYSTMSTPWDMQNAHPSLETIIAQLKLPRSRIAVLGCGRGHDAAFFASKGHKVEAFDFSKDAIDEARKLYGVSEQLSWHQMDAFALKKSHFQKFDIVFEHTFYPAVPPTRRNELVDLWRTLLVPRGHLLGIFLCFERPGGPPHSASEWEIQKRTEKAFSPLYWTRSRFSPPDRLGKELIVYLQNRS
ncbi:MAG: class I SAM-dependent methyltransferase [Bdellovibrionales bacterium CG10_big_fil_rev_8_21_14_0_10_45_34]|nr:MAG: class I SAM-dependent methyltransferase [Bdellovibrionales bacterium CG10_big_fil_rev_8_21_14_0_10_45_34]